MQPQQPNYAQWQPPAPPPPAPPRTSHRARNWAIGVAALVVVGGIAAAVSSGSSSGKKASGGTPIKSASTSAAASTSATTAPAVAAETPTGSIYVTPKRSDFKITLKVLTKDCFGEAGCNITYRPQLSMNLPSGSLDPSVTYDVTYEVRGGDDGAQTGTLAVTGDQYDQPSEEIASTASQGAKLVAVVTAVEAE